MSIRTARVWQPCEGNQLVGTVYAVAPDHLLLREKNGTAWYVRLGGRLAQAVAALKPEVGEELLINVGPLDAVGLAQCTLIVDRPERPALPSEAP